LARRPSSVLESVDLAVTVKNALELLETRLRDEEIEVSMALQSGAWHVKAEMIRLEQVCINLLANACDALSGRDDRMIRIEAVEDGAKIVATIRDSGVGIPADKLSQIFDPFFTTKEVGEGLGLGLAISYNIIKDFGGAIRVSSEVARGTTFTVILEKA
jgi:two-component system, NtrC family, phosphoglycerate transport system sensor histidine kinase PgtB